MWRKYKTEPGLVCQLLILVIFALIVGPALVAGF
jgi:hypothetical protein